MTIQVMAQEFVLLLERNERLSRDKEYLNIFQTRLGHLRELNDKISGVMSIYTLFQQVGLIRDANAGMREMIALIQEQKEQFAKQADWIRETRVMDGLRRKVIAFAERIGTDLSEKWKSYVFHYLPRLDEEVLQILGKVPAFTTEIQQIQTLIAQMKLNANQLPTTLAQIEAIHSYSQSIATIWGTLGAEEVPEAVLHFLREAGIRGASMELWTEEIRLWLSNHGLLPYFRIQLTK